MRYHTHNGIQIVKHIAREAMNIRPRIYLGKFLQTQVHDRLLLFKIYRSLDNTGNTGSQ